ncbi:hypothetical protein [Gloeocapsa sp. PCC 73106]|uniref:DUF7219 family protein n=1 Tax=Gloeocapsa sp. PCC 73106 TaxID=102232 RepID=UPI0002ACBDEA|nr:hypothetical protein [Gloeocapsa sp. PCC 73106]ELR97191.1 hypothetical protein GLO73106DRAFT_00009960 [Gloeocapsa sp. PCC 73106]
MSTGASGRDKDSFFYPMGNYQGKMTPENLVFNANLQEFAQKVAFICGLEANGKITPVEAYNKIRDLWDQLKQSKENLLGQDTD